MSKPDTNQASENIVIEDKGVEPTALNGFEPVTMAEVIDMLHYFDDDRIAEIRADLERQLADVQRKLAVIAMEEARRNE